MAAYKPAQIVRHAAIVLAGTASLSLTAVAGAYIVHEMADTQRSAAGIAAPPAPTIPEVVVDGRPVQSDAMLARRSLDLPALFVRAPATTTPHVIAKVPEGQVGSPTAAPTGFGGQLRHGSTYIGAQVAPGRADTVAFTVDTNALTVLTDYLLSESVREQLGIRPDPTGVTSVRTEVDTRSGELAMAFSDPNLGEHTLRLDSRPAPTKCTPPVPASATTATTPENSRAISVTATVEAPGSPATANRTVDL